MATSVCLKVLIDEEKNKVLFAQAGKDFIDMLLSFLTLPLGTIARLLTCKETNLEKVRFGSISSLYESVSNLDEKHFWTSTCKGMLLKPRHSMGDYFQNLKLKIDDGKEKMKYFICENWHCSRKSSGGLLTTFSNQICSCGKSMNRQIIICSSVINEKKIDNEGFLIESATFIISEDLTVKPDNFQNSVL